MAGRAAYNRKKKESSKKRRVAISGSGHTRVASQSLYRAGRAAIPRKGAVQLRTVTAGVSNSQYDSGSKLARAYVAQVADPLSVWQLPLARKYPQNVLCATSTASANIGPYYGANSVAPFPAGGYGTTWGLLICDSKYNTQWTCYSASSETATFTGSALVNNMGTTYNPGIASIPEVQLAACCIKGCKMEVQFTGAQSQGGGRLYYGTIPRTSNIAFLASTQPKTLVSYPGVDVVGIAELSSKHVEAFARKLSIAADNFIGTGTECDDISVPFFMWTGLSNYQTTGSLTSLNDYCFQVRVDCTYDVVPAFDQTGNPSVTSVGSFPPASGWQLELAENAMVALGSLPNTATLVENGQTQDLSGVYRQLSGSAKRARYETIDPSYQSLVSPLYNRQSYRRR